MDKRKMLVALTALMMLMGVLFSQADTETHSTTLTIQPTAPTITAVGPIAAVDLTDGSTKTVAINYTVTDTNGYGNIDTAELKVYVTEAGETDRINTSGDCETSGTGNRLDVICNVVFYYYDKAATWEINVTAKDDGGLYVDDATTATVVVNALDEITLNDTAINCNGNLVSPSSDNECEQQKVSNTGNQDYTTFQETAYDLDDDSTGLVTIAATNFAINTTDVATGTAMADSSAITIGGAALTHGDGNTEMLYMYVDIPTGKASDTYTSQSDWSLAVS